MEAEEALESIKEILQEKTRGLISLSPIESKVFVQIWTGKTYNEMPAFIFKANRQPYSYEYLKEIGTELINKIRDRLNIEDINKNNFMEEIERYLNNLNRNVNNQPIQPPYVNIPDTDNYNTHKPTPNVNLTNTDNQNPFIPTTGRIDNPAKLFGRETKIREIFEFLYSGSSVALIGEDGVGKSSLLWAICQQAENFSLNRQPVFIDLNTIRDKDDFNETLGDEIGIDKPLEFKRKLRNKRILLVLDNIGKFIDEGFTRGLRDELRGLAEGENAPFKLVVAASEPLDKLFNDSQSNGKTSALEGIFQQVDIFPWSKGTCFDFIAKRLKPTKINFTEADIQELIQASGGHPQKLTQLCYNLYKKYSESTI